MKRYTMAYNPDVDNFDDGYVEDKSGEWVRYEDVAALVEMLSKVLEEMKR